MNNRGFKKKECIWAWNHTPLTMEEAEAMTRGEKPNKRRIRL